MTVYTNTRARAHARTHTHTHKLLRAEDSIAQLKCSETRNVLSLFLKEESSRVFGVFREVAPDVRTEVRGQRCM